jgi:hypothetical protein
MQRHRRRPRSAFDDNPVVKRGAAGSLALCVARAIPSATRSRDRPRGVSHAFPVTSPAARTLTLQTRRRHPAVGGVCLGDRVPDPPLARRIPHGAVRRLPPPRPVRRPARASARSPFGSSASCSRGSSGLPRTRRERSVEGMLICRGERTADRARTAWRSKTILFETANFESAAALETTDSTSAERMEPARR